MSKKIILAAGGTGGHLFPAQALAKELTEKGLEVLFVGGRLGTNPFFQRQFPFQEISAATPSLSHFFVSSYKILKGVLQSFKILKERPALVIGFGSFHAFPMLLAALLRGVPYLLFESDRLPGKVNRLFAKNAQICAVQFEDVALKGKKVAVAVPLWKGPQKNNVLEEAYAYFGLTAEYPVILVFGGSQGASGINRLFMETLNNLENKNFQVLHFVGKGEDVEKVQKKYQDLKIRVLVKPFEEQMDRAWQVAHFAICRAGAMTLAEQFAFKVPAILIPYPLATGDHQTQNALLMKERGGAIVLDEKGCTAQMLALEIEKLLEIGRVDEMKEKMKQSVENVSRKTLAEVVQNFVSLQER